MDIEQLNNKTYSTIESLEEILSNTNEPSMRVQEVIETFASYYQMLRAKRFSYACTDEDKEKYQLFETKLAKFESMNTPSYNLLKGRINELINASNTEALKADEAKRLQLKFDNQMNNQNPNGFASGIFIVILTVLLGFIIGIIFKTF